eukprot:5181080-Ditylum_brightwellii.AAC.1
MMRWGGGNLDQSLRIWRCGGEIVSTSKSYVAHMWRDEKHTSKYKFQMFHGKSVRKKALDVSSVQENLMQMKCHSLQWYLDRFSYIYCDGGVLTHEVFQLKANLDLSSSLVPLFVLSCLVTINGIMLGTLLTHVCDCPAKVRLQV